jgi:hypothetical protein
MRTKLLIIIIISLCLTGTIGTFWGAQIVEAASGLWNSCPRGQINCHYPGKCNLYTDTNNDAICDRSQSAPATTTPTPAVNVSIPSTTNLPTTTSVKSTPIFQEDILTANLSSNSSGTLPVSDQNIAGASSTLEIKHSYYFLPILLALAILYALTWTLAVKKLLRNMLHRKIWNSVLLVSMMISALLGIFLILAIDFNIKIALPFDMLFWHVEAGIALGIVGIFHIIWHWRYFAKLIKVTP